MIKGIKSYLFFWKDYKNRQTSGKTEQSKKRSSTNNFRPERGATTTDIVEMQKIENTWKFYGSKFEKPFSRKKKDSENWLKMGENLHYISISSISRW